MKFARMMLVLISKCKSVIKGLVRFNVFLWYFFHKYNLVLLVVIQNKSCLDSTD